MKGWKRERERAEEQAAVSLASRPPSPSNPAASRPIKRVHPAITSPPAPPTPPEPGAPCNCAPRQAAGAFEGATLEALAEPRLATPRSDSLEGEECGLHFTKRITYMWWCSLNTFTCMCYTRGLLLSNSSSFTGEVLILNLLYIYKVIQSRIQ